MTECDTKKAVGETKKRQLVPPSPNLPHPVQLPFIFLFNPLFWQRTQIQSHKKGKGRGKGEKGRGKGMGKREGEGEKGRGRKRNCLIGFVRSAVFKLSIVLFLSSSSSFSKAIRDFLCAGRKAEISRGISLCAQGVAVPVPTTHCAKPWGS